MDTRPRSGTIHSMLHGQIVKCIHCTRGSNYLLINSSVFCWCRWQIVCGGARVSAVSCNEFIDSSVVIQISIQFDGEALENFHMNINSGYIHLFQIQCMPLMQMDIFHCLMRALISFRHFLCRWNRFLCSEIQMKINIVHIPSERNRICL